MTPNDSEFKLHLLSAIKSVAESLREVRYQSNEQQISHSAIVSYATYSPWLDDLAFQKILPTVSSHSLLDVYRLYNLWELVGQVCSNKSLNGDILEVGSWRGGSGSLMGYRCQLEQSDARIFLADTFRGVAKAGDQDTLYRGGEHSDTTVETVIKLGQSLKLSNIELLEGLFPEQTGQQVESRKFRLCHIDVDAYQSGKDVFEWVWPRLETGGIVVFDDFGFWGCEGITKLVHSIREGCDRVFVHNLNGQAIFVKTVGNR